MDDTAIKATHQARHAKNWICTKCAWSGNYSSTIGVMYRGVDWQHCPSCNAIALPITGSTMTVKQHEETILPQYICMACKTILGYAEGEDFRPKVDQGDPAACEGCGQVWCWCP